jgi:sulfotransferase family protein
MTTGRDIVWLASYPKSGNTWVRFMLCNLMFGVQSSAAELGQRIPDVHEVQITTGVPGGLFKTHFMYYDSMPLRERTAGCLYIVRHPADVLVSNFHYAVRAAGTEPTAAALDRYVEDFLAHRGDPRWARLGMGSWEANVRSWLAETLAFPVIRLRYEDLQRDAMQGAQTLSKSLGLAASPERIAEAVRHSSFERMREIEQQDIQDRRVGIFYKPYLEPAIHAGRRFMRAGTTGDGARTLSDSQRARLADAFGPLLQALGY